MGALTSFYFSSLNAFFMLDVTSMGVPSSSGVPFPMTANQSRAMALNLAMNRL